MNKHIKIVVLALALASMARAEIVVGGRVTDSEQQPIPYATISLTTVDSVLLTGCTTTLDGTYEVGTSYEKECFVTASYVGYTSVTQAVEVGKNANIDFVLHEEATQLGEVEVKAKRPLVERKLDKLVLNVSQSPLAAGSNGKELLKLAPGVNIDKDGNVTVNGKSVEVYVDDRPSHLSGEQLKAMLEGTDGNTIEKIEVVSNPSAKYDASGTGGIINIKLKRNMMKGLNGTLSASYGGMYFRDVQRYVQQDYASLNLNYRTEKTYTFLNLTQMYQDPVQLMQTETQMPVGENIMTSRSHTLYDITGQYYMLKLGNDWMIDKKNTLGFILQVPTMLLDYQTRAGAGNSVILLDNDTIERGETYNSAHSLSPQHSANLNFTHVFNDSLERELTINLDYNRFLQNTASQQANAYWRQGTESLEGLNIKQQQVVNIYSGKIDFQTNFWGTGMLEAGVKYTLSQTQNEMQTDSTLWETLVSSTPSTFNYAEHVAAAYITAGKQFGEHWSVKLGLRGEYTNSTGYWQTADSVTHKSYFDLFPTAFVGYTSKPLGKAQQPISATLSYTRRIKRPNYNMLNPFVTYLNAHTYYVGNTALTPEFNNDVEVTLSYSQYVSLTGNFSHTQDMFSDQTIIMPNGDYKQTYQNFGTCTTHGINLSLTEVPLVPKFETVDEQSDNQTLSHRKVSGAWLSLTANLGYYNFRNRSYEKNAQGEPRYVSSSHHFSGDATLNAYLPKNWVISLGGWYGSPYTIGYSRVHDMGMMYCGVRKSFPKQGLVLNLKFNDILRSFKYKEESTGLETGYYSSFEQPGHWQKLSLTVSYTFGTQQWRKQRNVGNLDESNRLGGGGGVGGK